MSLAKELLGKLIKVKYGESILSGYIVETEAYLGKEDMACHGYNGNRTPKVEALYQEKGTVYIYTMHTHKMLNIVSMEEGNPHTVLKGNRACQRHGNNGKKSWQGRNSRWKWSGKTDKGNGNK